MRTNFQNLRPKSLFTFDDKTQVDHLPALSSRLYLDQNSKCKILDCLVRIGYFAGMGYWLVIREILGVRDCYGPVFLKKVDAEAFAKNEGLSQFNIEHWSIDDSKRHDDKVYLASSYFPKDDLYEFFGLYPNYDDAKVALRNRFGKEKQLVLAMTPA